VVRLNSIEARAVVIVLAVFLAVAVVRWRQAESSRVELKIISESEEAASVQR